MKRSLDFVFVSQCLLAQGIRAQKIVKHYPSVVNPLIDFLQNENVNIIPLECPEILYEGYYRQPGFERYVSDPNYKEHCGSLAMEVNRKKNILTKGNELKLLGVIGVAGSPSCAVRKLNYRLGKKGKGVFMKQLSILIKTSFLEFDSYLQKKTMEEIKKKIKKNKRR
ncbi:MAG: hypothetical protein ACOCQR_03400 [bacterium]